MRVGICGFLQESNTFLSAKTTIEHFRQDVLVTGEEIRERMHQAHHEMGGFFAGLDDAGVEAVPLLLARALPFGPIRHDSYSALCEMLQRQLDDCGKLDGMLVACHGANVSESVPDADGDWLTRIRQRIGTDVPIIATLDLHGNLSERMVAMTDALIAYQTNPHVDQRERGLEAAALLRRVLIGEVRLTQAAAFPPLAINIERQLTSESPCREHFAQAKTMRARPGVLSTSILLGFPYADVPEMGSSIVVVTNDDLDLAHRLADELAVGMWRDRGQFVGKLIDVETAIDRALEAEGPVCLLDMGDNVGGGSPADGTVITEALHRRRVGPAFVCLLDPDSVERAVAAGIGTRMQMVVGAKTDALHGQPIATDFTVQSLHDGCFHEPNARHGGFTDFDQGPTAILESDFGLTVMLTSRRMVPFSLRQLTACGLDPAAFKILVAKGVHAPVAAYETVCRHFIRVDTPGITSADMTRFEYRNRRRPLFPLERRFAWHGQR